MLEASGNSRGSNKRWNQLIYTPKHVLHLLEHPPIIGAKKRKCFSMISPNIANSVCRSHLDTNRPRKYPIMCYYTYKT